MGCERLHLADSLKGIYAMYIITKSILPIVMLLVFNSELMADHPIGINTYLGKWKWSSNENFPSAPTYTIKQIGDRIEIEALSGNGLVSNIKHNPYSMSFSHTFAKTDPMTGESRLNITLFPDIRTNANLFNVRLIETENIYIIDLMTPAINGKKNKDQIKVKNGIPNDLTKCALENIYKKQWDLREITCCDDKVSLKIAAMDNSLHAIFEHRGNTAQIPAKIVGNTITISFELNEYDDMKNIPLFKASRKYHLQLIPLCGNKDHLIIKGCSISEDDTACTYFMAFSK